jgi:hypothetical protein
MKYHIFNNDEIDWYILLSSIRVRIQIRSGLRGRIRIRIQSKTRPDLQHCCQS